MITWVLPFFDHICTYIFEDIFTLNAGPSRQPRTGLCLDLGFQISTCSFKKNWDRIQETLDLGKSIFHFLNQELFDLKKIHVVNLKTGCPKKMPYVGEFVT